MKLHVDDGDDRSDTIVAFDLVKTTTQLYGLPHDKAKAKASLFHKNLGFYNHSCQLQISTQIVIG